MRKLHNKIQLKETRKVLRTNSTSAEATLWKSLKNKNLDGRKFRRQHSIHNYIVDFYCPSERIIIELDGAFHLDFINQQKDHERDQQLERLGYKVLRFENKFVFEDIEMVLNSIREAYQNP
jgi:very-short-patch-repair endonuclease